MQNNLINTINPVIKHKRVGKKPLKKAVFRSSTFCSSNGQQNENKFAEFIKDKPHQIFEKKKTVEIPFSLFFCPFPISFLLNRQEQLNKPLQNVSKISSLLGGIYCYRFDIAVGKEFIFDDGVHQEFSRHFKNNLQKIKNLCVESAFVEWIATTYLNAKEVDDPKDKRIKPFIDLIKHKGIIRQGNTTKHEAKTILKLRKDGLSQSKIAVKLLQIEDSSFPSERPKDDKARIEWKDKIDEKTIAVQNTIYYHNKQVRHSEILLKQFKGLLVVGKMYLITPDDN